MKDFFISLIIGLCVFLFLCVFIQNHKTNESRNKVFGVIGKIEQLCECNTNNGNEKK